MNDPRLALAGFVTGLLVGMTGMGGGWLMTPILIFFFNFNPSTAIGTDILHGAIFKSFGAVRHRRLGTVRARAWRRGCSSAALRRRWSESGWPPTSPTATGTASTPSGQVLGYTLLFGAVAFVVKALTHGAERPRPRPSEHARPGHRRLDRDRRWVHRRPDLGRERILALAMLLAYPLAAKYVVGADIAHAAALLFVAGIGPPDRRERRRSRR